MGKHKQFIKDAYNGEFGSMCSEWKETILKSYPEFEKVEFKVGDWIIDKKINTLVLYTLKEYDISSM